MKKGRQYPKAQTTWVSGRQFDWSHSMPTFVRVRFVALMCYPVDDPTIFPVPITGADCSIGKYNYGTATGGDFWSGIWANAWGDGYWHLAQCPGAEHDRLFAFSIYYTQPSAGSYMAQLSTPNDEDGLWDTGDWEQKGIGGFCMPSYPFVFLTFTGCKPCTYAEIRSAGYVNWDTRPNTFVYDAPP